MNKTVVELFAGVGGFRVGLNNVTLDENENTIENGDWDFVWVNQWEPSTKSQPAFDCYTKRFGDSPNHVNEDIALVDKKTIPDHTLLVGGFPCQDYSVARGLSGEKGIQGKKGVLWWQIHEILETKKPPFVLLENVDRLLKSPSKQRGRDFGIMLRGLHDLGYGVEWKVINAADYGMPQRRRRVFIYAFHKTTNFHKSLVKHDMKSIIIDKGMFSKTFPIDQDVVSKHKDTQFDFTLYEDIVEISDIFKGFFRNSGAMINGKCYTVESTPKSIEPVPLKNILEKRVAKKYYIEDDKYQKLEYLKSSKKIPRVRPNGETYFYSEGQMSIPEDIDLPSRTMLTSETSVNRSTHVVQVSKKGKPRLLTPTEAERLNTFPDNWTNTGMTEKQRYFMMGNALVCNIVSEIGISLSEIIKKEND